jgi:predicted MFS family arabinose efflux permease
MPGIFRATAPQYKWVVVAVLSVVAFLNEVDRHAIYALFPLLEKDLGMSKLQLGLLGSAFLWAYALLGPQAGYVGDRFPRRYVIIGSLALWSVMTGLNGFATSGSQLIYLRVLLAVSEAFYMPCALALISEHHTEKTRSKGIAIHLSAMAVGQVAGGFLGGFMGQYFSWRALFLLLGGAGIAYAPLLLLLLHNAPVSAHAVIAKRPSFLEAGREVVHIRTLRLLCLAFVGYSIVGSVMQTWLPYFLFHKFHASLTTAGFSAAFYLQLPTAVGNIAWGAVGDYFATRNYRGRMLVQAGSLLISAPFLLSMGLAGSIFAIAVSLMLLGFLRTGWPPNVMAVIFQLVPARLSSTTYGLLNFCGNVSAGLALLVASDVGARFGFGTAFASLCTIHAAAAGILMFAAFRTLRHDFLQPSPQPAFAAAELKSSHP